MSALHGTWDHLGARQALGRLSSWACSELGITPFVPEWVTFYEIEETHAVVHDDPSSTLDILRKIRLVRVNMDNLAEGNPVVDTLGNSDPPDGIDSRMYTALVRLAYGEMCEASARTQALRQVPRDSVAHNLHASYARLMFDSYVASVWSTTHAEYVCTVEELREIMPLHTKTEDIQPPTPSPRMITYCLSGMPDLAHLVDRRGGSSLLIAKMTSCKAALYMTTLFNRCTSTSSRGWESAVFENGKDADACARVCCNATIAAFTGLNPAIHPAARPTWEQRLAIHRVIMSHSSDPKKTLSMCGCASREAMRLYLAMTLSNTPSVREALLTSGHAAGTLIMSPFELSPSSLQSAATTLASIGIVVMTEKSIERVLSLNDECFSDEAKRAKKSAQISSSSRALVAVRVAGVVVPPLAAHTLKVRPVPLTSLTPTLVNSVGELSFECFNADFTAFWNVMWKRKFRVSRLNEAQHRVLHDMSPIRKLLQCIPDKRRLFVQRVALTEPRASLLTSREVAKQLGLDVPEDDGTTLDLTTCSATAAADLMLYARVAAMKSTLTSFSLGEKTRKMQIRALAKRLLVDVFPGDSADCVLERIPVTARNLCLCVECRRVANAVQEFKGKNTPFNEFGITSSMLRVDGDLENGRLRCSKRSSAVLRASVQLEIDSTLPSNGEDEDTHNVDMQSLLPKLKRDKKTCFDQTGIPVPCGDQDLVMVPIVGRMVQAFGTFYSLCAFCGVLCFVSNSNRFDGEICCMRCDYKLLTKDRPHMVHAPCEEEPHHFCRFCGKRDSAPKSASKWKIVHAPQDDGGYNANVPAPLRTVVYCSSHSKQWVAAAHRSSMTMAEVFAHLSMKIKPVFNHEDVSRPAIGFKNVMPVEKNKGVVKLKQRAIRKLKRRSRLGEQ